jgi:hypothetical protein
MVETIVCEGFDDGWEAMAIQASVYIDVGRVYSVQPVQAVGVLIVLTG